MRRRPHNLSSNDGDNKPPSQRDNKRDTSFNGPKHKSKPMVRNEDPAWSQPNYESEGYDHWTKALGDQAKFEAETRRIQAESESYYLRAEADTLRSSSPGKVGSVIQAVTQVIGVCFIFLILIVLLV